MNGEVESRYDGGVDLTVHGVVVGSWGLTCEWCVEDDGIWYNGQRE